MTAKQLASRRVFMHAYQDNCMAHIPHCKQGMSRASKKETILRIAMHYQRGQQQWWSGKRWVADPSDADEFSSRAEARVVSICNLGHADRAVVVDDYGFVSEQVLYSVNVDGDIVAGPGGVA